MRICNSESSDGSETRDELFEDDVQSDVEDEEIASEDPDINTALLEDQFTGSYNSVSSSDSRILTFSEPTIRSKSKYCWTTSKGKNTGRVFSSNIVLTARGPTRQCKSLLEPLSCFNAFF